MSTTTADNLKDSARDAWRELKSTTMDHVTEPVLEKSRELLKAARHGAESAAALGRRGLSRSESWISDHPLEAAGLAFGAGLVAGILLLGGRRG